MRWFTFVFLFLLFMGVVKSDAQTADSIESKYDTSFQKLIKLHGQVKGLYKALENLQPIAIAENSNFYIFEPCGNSSYKFVKKTPWDFPVPRGIRAAMPLQGYGFKSVCVISGDAFDKLEDCIIIFHEFVHCLQFQTVEFKLKDKLVINKEEMSKGNFMWELNYKFPYEDEKFEKSYTEFLNALGKSDEKGIASARENLKNILSFREYEYMTWQEWKEGYARYIENKLRKFLDVKINDYGKEKPYNRISFYAGGSGYIDYLVNSKIVNADELEEIYNKIMK